MKRDFVLDASALLATLHDEPGGDSVVPLLPHCVISAVNWSEVVQKSIARGVDVAGLREDVTGLGLEIEPFSTEDSEASALIWREPRALGLSLGDRACLALARRLKLPALTADRSWVKARLSVKVRVIR